MDLERVLTKLRYDESVSGYSLITTTGAPFLTFSIPDEVIPQIRGTLEVHSKSLRLMNIMTGQGTVVLARVDKNWVLAVLFNPDQSLGMCLQKAQNVVESLEGVELPPPPRGIDQEPPETITESPTIDKSTEFDLEEEGPPDIPFEEIQVKHGCVVHKNDRYSEAMNMGSKLNDELLFKFSNTALDTLLMVDEQRTVHKISETLSKRLELIIDIVKWCVSKHVLSVECPSEQQPGAREIVEVPVFEGELKKAKKEHRSVLELCSGNLTVQQIADQLGITYFQALQSIVPYRGKSVKFIRRDKSTK
ncbi:MAG: hypothetical protein BAJATHORv1_10374 [Candidatus Thorarchaeota archaeon]|nr:MAG: hypothetical protein BAJATHORv1_10374 [Candidatus Thorarchaeota archaeon]